MINEYQTINFENGAKYCGRLNNKGEFEGLGTLYYPNHSICYKGTWKQNMFSG